MPPHSATSPSPVDTETIRQDAGAVFCFGFPGTTLGPEVRAHVLERHLRTLILFRRNVDSGPQVAALTRDIRALRPDTPPIIAADQEGGAVARFRGVTTDFPSMAVLGATEDRGLAHAFGTTLAEELTALGIEMDFAPVVDVHSNPDNPVIADRSFGPDPAVVSAMASAQIKGMEAGGLISCAKHFPGHGDTHSDSHKALPTLPHDLTRLRAIELAPFQAAIKAGVPAIMTAHIIFEALDAKRPATLSPKVLGGLLREELGFEGVIITDDLEMNAIAQGIGVVEGAIQSLKAGADLVIISHTLDLQIEAWERVVALATKDPNFRTRLADAARRVRGLEEWIAGGPYPDPEELGEYLRGPNAQSLARDITTRGQALLGAIPRRPDPTQAPA